MTDHSHKVLKVFAFLIGIGLLLSLFCRQEQSYSAGPQDKPNIIIVTFDGLAARQSSLHGYKRETTPFLKKFAEQASWFSQARGTSNYTLMTLPRIQGYYTYPLAAPLTLLLERAGWSPARYVSAWRSVNLNIHALENLPPVRSFEENPLHKLLSKFYGRRNTLWLAGLGTEESFYFNPFRFASKSEIFWQKEHFDPQLIFGRGLDYLKQRRSGAVLWIHCWAPHAPWVPPQGFKNKFGGGELPGGNPVLINREYKPEEQAAVDQLRNLYDEYLLYTDNCFGQFLEDLKREGLYDNAIMVVSSDHGSSLDNGFVGHTGPYLWDELTHIPLLFKLPGKPPGKVDSFASLVDIAPTLLEYLNIPVPTEMHGESLLPYITGQKQRSLVPKFAYSMGSLSGKGESAVYWDKYRLVWTTGKDTRLYDSWTGTRVDKDGEELELEKKMREMLRFSPQDLFQMWPEQ